jgi:magnesium chelatase family protein
VVVSVTSAAVHGLQGRLVEVQADVANGSSVFNLVGLAAAAVREARERVRSAIRNSGLPFPLQRLTVNLAPAELRKEGTALDLAVAVAVVLAEARSPAPASAGFLGQLALDGRVVHVDGVLVAMRALAEAGIERVFVAAADAEEAALVPGPVLHPCDRLDQVIKHLRQEETLPVFEAPAVEEPTDPPKVAEDLAEVHGQEAARRGLEVAAAGGHHLLMSGPPGAGKTMLARCLPGLLPPLTLPEALEVAAVRSVLGDLRNGRPLEWTRPFRSPHHTVSTAGLVGGGADAGRPGEISRAHCGVLFLDELAEFGAATLQALRQPLEEGRVTITRAGGSAIYPARFLLVAATNPCACGFAGDRERACRCSAAAVDAHQRALSGPLLDRIDLQVHVTRPRLEALSEEPRGEASVAVRRRVVAARKLQLERQRCLNGALGAEGLRRYAALTTPARRALERWAAARGLSARGFHRAWRVSRTVADLDGEDETGERHVLEALGYRLRAAA